MARNRSVVRRAGRSSVDKALELLRTAEKKPKKCKENETIRKMLPYCTLTRDYISKGRKTIKSPHAGFSRLLALSEMRTCLGREDWVHLSKLLLVLLNGSTEFEVFVWRYLLTLLLCSPASSPLHLENFFRMCVGTRNEEETESLERLLSLTTE